jgi:hypothetical protein
LDHDLDWQEPDTPCGIVDEESAQLDLLFGRSCQTSDLIVDTLEAKWNRLEEHEKSTITKLQINIDNGPESSGRRTPFLYRMVQFCDAIGKSIQWLYDPPYPSQYNAIERCWGILEQHWNGTKRIDVGTMLEWATSMTWKGLHPVVERSRQVDQKGVKLSKKAMEAVEVRLERDATLPQYDLLIKPASTA